MEENSKQSLIQEIIESEWKMFDAVQNIGGRADCQDDFETFSIMRSSQLSAWDTTVLESYRDDHRAAAAEGANLIERKYAYMMQFTDPVYFGNMLARYLPPISDEVYALVDEIAAVYSRWYREAARKYPAFVGRGRPENEEEETYGVTSVDAYLKGELYSYSDETRRRLLAMVKRMETAGENLVCATYDATARSYGYRGLDDAEEKLEKRTTL